MSAKTAAVSIDAKVPPFTFRFPGASSLIRSLRSVMRLRRARPPQSCCKPHHCWAGRRKPPESQLLKKTPKRRCYLIRLIWCTLKVSRVSFSDSTNVG
ncbi:hypothetical protein C5W82_24955 [Salmonella enterica subsp. enterica]|nr:hypothetical protein [Salmonella enterica subsp. enterica]ECF8718306.1 hypothetical protein [Salmonella enterica subsp. enterica]EDF8103388.1 hypothetical protein [Salmonella enterica subsp. enterica serovar Rissen]